MNITKAMNSSNSMVMKEFYLVEPYDEVWSLEKKFSVSARESFCANSAMSLHIFKRSVNRKHMYPKPVPPSLRHTGNSSCMSYPSSIIQTVKCSR